MRITTARDWALGNVEEGLAWLGGGVALVVVAMAFSILGDADAEGLKLAAIVAAFSVGFTAGALAMVRGALLVMAHATRQVALQLLVATIFGIVVAIVLHNVVYAMTGVEEGVFFLSALLVGPVVLVAAIIRAFRPYRPLQHGEPSRP